MFGASRSMIGTALSLLRVQATEVVWLGRGQSSNNRDCAAVMVFSSLEEASRALDGLNAVHAPFASSLSGGRLVARWANQRAGSQGSESRAMGSASDAAGQIRPSVAPRMQTRQGEDASCICGSAVAECSLLIFYDQLINNITVPFQDLLSDCNRETSMNVDLKAKTTAAGSSSSTTSNYFDRAT